MKESPKVPAFKEKLVPHAEHGKWAKDGSIAQLENRTDLVVRPLDWTHFLNKSLFHPEWDGTSMSAIEFAQITKQHFDELATYGIEAPVSFVVAEQDRGKGPMEEVFAIVRNVKRIEHPDKEELGRAFANVRAALLKYYTTKYKTKGSFLADLFRDSQYVYGTIDDSKPRIYLVDVDPFIYRGNKNLNSVLKEFKREITEERNYFSIPEYDAIRDGFEHLSREVESSTFLA